MEKYVVVGDVGGTNTTLALLKINRNNFEIIYERKFKTSKYKNFTDIVNLFIKKIPENIKLLTVKGVFAVAGKTEEEKIEMVNTNLVIDKREIIKNTQLKNITLINDFDAIAYAIDKLKDEDLTIINDAKPKKEKPKALIGAGTGLGESILTYDIEKKRYIPLSSEGGHEDFPPQNKEEFKICEFIKKRDKKTVVEWENLLSGKGIETIYEFLTGKKLSAEEISKLKKKDKLAERSFKLFYKFYARVAKNIALETLSEGGVYLGGGIITKNLDFNKNDFIEEFTNNKKYNGWLKKIPIYAIKNYDVSILGLGNYTIMNPN